MKLETYQKWVIGITIYNILQIYEYKLMCIVFKSDCSS